MNTKICTKCGEEKDAEANFSWSIRGIKRHSRCKSCHAEERADYYARNKDKELEYKYERQKDRKEIARRIVTEYLKSHPCESCRETDILVLTFHHVHGTKKMDISQMVNQGYSPDAMREEMGKCIILCFNCHMRAEKEKRGTKYW
jgi:deoxycytidylate deaminase